MSFINSAFENYSNYVQNNKPENGVITAELHYNASPEFWAEKAENVIRNEFVAGDGKDSNLAIFANADYSETFMLQDIDETLPPLEGFNLIMYISEIDDQGFGEQQQQLDSLPMI